MKEVEGCVEPKNHGRNRGWGSSAVVAAYCSSCCCFYFSAVLLPILSLPLLSSSTALPLLLLRIEKGAEETIKREGGSCDGLCFKAIGEEEEQSRGSVAVADALLPPPCCRCG